MMISFTSRVLLGFLKEKEIKDFSMAFGEFDVPAFGSCAFSVHLATVVSVVKY